MKLKKLDDQLALIFTKKESEIIKNIVNKADLSLADLQKIIEDDTMIEEKLSNGMVQNIISQQIKQKIRQKEGGEKDAK